MFVDQFNREYFDAGLSPDVLERLRRLPVDRDDPRAFLDRDAAMLAQLCGALRSNQSFFEAYTVTADGLRREIGLCPRQPDGHLADIDKDIPAAELWQRAADFPDRLGVALGQHAVAVLSDAGYAARVNEAGHVAVRI
jgi:hypothetical protein